MENKNIEHLYVIGPISGIENNNKDEFELVREALERYKTIFSRRGPQDIRTSTLWITQVDIPHDFVDENAPWEVCMMDSISNLTATIIKEDDDDREYRSPYYDGIAMLDGWELSRGARIEYDLAQLLGIPCKPWREWHELLQ